jgi:hypothetical protein
LFKRAFDTDRTAGQITVIPTGLAAFVIFDAVLTKVAWIGRPEFLTDLNQNLAFRPKLPAAPASSFKLAKVHFVVDTADKIGFDDIEQSFDHNNAQRCKDLGFAKTAACAANQFKARLCPYDDAYYDRCCDNDYKYTKGECSYPNTISSTSCGGKYKCYCDTALYPYTSANCPAPKELSDKCVDASGAHYAECKCPFYYKPCDASKNLVGVGEACPGVGETVYAACDCKSGYKYVCEEFGPTNPNDFCQNGIKYYKSCKTCGDYGYLTSCPTGIECSFEQCSGKYFPTGKCASGYTDISDASCNWYKYWIPCSVAPERPSGT